MLSPTRAVKKSLVSSVSEVTKDIRHEQIATVGSLPKRAGLLAAHAVASRYPQLVARTLGINYSICRLQVVGSGNDSIVYKLDEKSVLKVDKPSLLMEAEERRAYADAKKLKHEQMTEALGDLVLPESVFIAPQPNFPDWQAVQSVQDYIDASDPNLFVPMEAGVSIPNLDALQARSPTMTRQLSALVERSFRLHDAYELVPDVVGIRNLVIDSADRLLVIDGRPLGRDDRACQTLGMQRIESLGAALETML